jgi:N-formylglutamate amidohydrolase
VKGFWTQILPRFPWIFLFLALLCPSGLSFAQTNLSSYTPGTTYYGRVGVQYIEYIAGNLPLIISAPHGGSLNPSELPDRTYGTLDTDTNTDNLARAVRTAVFNRYGRYPHVIICNVDRQKIDCNREIVEGAQGNTNTILAWNEYHTFLGLAKKAVTDSYGRGLLIDLHGHGHSIQRLEIGYNTDTADLFKTTLSSSDRYDSSVQELGIRTRVTFDQLIRGDLSLGTLMQARGFPSVPSTTYPNQGTSNGVSNSYFTGGYIIETYGSKASNSGAINAIQIECNYTGVRDTSTSRANFASALTEALDLYFPLHVGMKLNTLAPPPSISRFSDTTIDEDNSTSPLSLILSDFSSTLTATSSSSSLVSSTGLSFGGSGTNRTLTITPQPNASGSNAMVTVTATSPEGGTGVEWFYLTINPVNDAPVFSSVADRAINPGVSLTIPASAIDVEGASLGYTLVSGPAGSSVNPSTGTFIWRPTIAQSGATYPVAIRATESGTGGLSSTLNFQAIVNPSTAPQISTAWIPGGLQSSPQVQLSMNGQLGPDYLVWASEDLVNWVNLTTATPTTFPFVWTDANASQYPKRFYQVRLGP